MHTYIQTYIRAYIHTYIIDDVWGVFFIPRPTFAAKEQQVLGKFKTPSVTIILFSIMMSQSGKLGSSVIMIGILFINSMLKNNAN